MYIFRINENLMEHNNDILEIKKIPDQYYFAYFENYLCDLDKTGNKKGYFPFFSGYINRRINYAGVYVLLWLAFIQIP